MLTHDDFLTRVNRGIRDYYMSPVRNAPNDSVAKSYWTDPAMNRFPYQQGYLVAAYLDARTREATSSKSTLDSALRTLMRSPRHDNSFTTDDFISAFPAAARADVRRALTDFVRDGQTVPVLAGGFDRCATADTRTLYRFDLGFDVSASTRDRRVSGVRSGSPADSAGLRNGQTMRGWSWNNGDTDNPVVLSVADSGAAAARKISYLARGATMDVPQLVAMAGDCAR
jgi:predicted metalloprotease with PDZ domain